MGRRSDALLIAGAWVVLVAALVVSGHLIKDSHAVVSFDHRVTAWVVRHRTDTLTAVMKVLTWAGSWIAAVGMVAVVVVLGLRGRLAVGVIGVVLLGWLGEDVAVTIAKHITQRPRPPEAIRLVTAHGWSFPSGHSANAVVMFTACAVIVCAFTHRRTLHILTWTLAALMAATVAFSRVELGVHWTTDVVAGTVWTSIWIGVLFRLRRGG